MRSAPIAVDEAIVSSWLPYLNELESLYHATHWATSTMYLAAPLISTDVGKKGGWQSWSCCWSSVRNRVVARQVYQEILWFPLILLQKGVLGGVIF